MPTRCPRPSVPSEGKLASSASNKALSSASLGWKVGVEDSIHFLCVCSGAKLSVPSVPLHVLLGLKIECHVSFDSLLPLSYRGQRGACSTGSSSGSAVDGCVGVPKAREDVTLKIVEFALVNGLPLIKVPVVYSFNIRAVLGIRLECLKCPLMDILERNISSGCLGPITRRQRKSHFSARVWDSTESYLETGRRDTRDLARSPFS